MAYYYMPIHAAEGVRDGKYLPIHAAFDKVGGGAEVPTEGQIWPRGDKASG